MNFPKQRRLTQYVSPLIVFVTILFFSGITFADDLDDVESEMDSAISESDAAVEESVAAKRRAKEEQKELEKAKKEAQAAIAKARSKERDARQQIKEMERKIADLQKKKSKFVGQKGKADIDYEKHVQNINKKKQELVKLEAELETMEDEKKRKQGMVATKVGESRDVEKELTALKDQKSKILRKLEKAKKDDKASEARLNRVRKEVDTTKLSQDKKLEKYAMQIQMHKENTRKNETKIRELRKGLDLLEEQVETAQAEEDESSQRAKESKKRLEKVKKTSRERSKKLKKKKKIAVSSRKRLDAQADNAALDASSLEGTNLQETAPDPAAKKKVKVSMKSKRRRTLKNSCNLRNLASTKSKVLKQYKKGSRLVISNYNKKWNKIHLASGKRAYMAKSCFK